jgi:phosphomannomutase
MDVSDEGKNMATRQEKELTCFKAYDVRGKLGAELNTEIAYRIGRAFAEYLEPKNVVLGGDVRETSLELKQALALGITDAGSDVIDIGMVGTEEVYFATSHLDADGGIEVTASHNPINYNGMKFVRKSSAPISGDTGLFDIKALAENGVFKAVQRKGSITKVSNLETYVEHILSYIDIYSLQPLRLVVNAGNGAAGQVIDKIERVFNSKGVPVSFIKVHHEPDPSFPNGIPNPLLSENRASTREVVINQKADLGIAWDGDFDRCFLFDENGRFVEGYYIVGLLAEVFLKKNHGAKVIHDPRLTWNTQEVVRRGGGEPIMSKTGHAFIKERMRQENAVYGGEMSAHHYFRDFSYCDSGMIPWLLVIELVSLKRAKLSELVDDAIQRYPSSGEINCKLKDPDVSIQRVKDVFMEEAIETDSTDGLSMVFSNWRFNLRCSNTEPVVRLNVESRGDVGIMKQKTELILSVINS